MTLKKEIDVVEVIRTHRFLNSIMTRLIAPTECEDLLENNRYIVVNPDMAQQKTRLRFSCAVGRELATFKADTIG